jgi:pyruvate/2-oxoglutarate dehydrogenase complex dihydrolipoamide dehydrogenase (E3) component
MLNMTVLMGAAHFTGPRTVAVADRVLRAPQVFINTGGWRTSRGLSACRI